MLGILIDQGAEPENFSEATPALKRAEEIFVHHLGADPLKAKEDRLDWLANYKQAGGVITPEHEDEFFRGHPKTNIGLDDGQEVLMLVT